MKSFAEGREEEKDRDGIRYLVILKCEYDRAAECHIFKSRKEAEQQRAAFLDFCRDYSWSANIAAVIEIDISNSTFVDR